MVMVCMLIGLLNLSSRFPEFQRQQAFFLGVQQHDLHDGAVFSVADVGVPVLRHFANDGLIRNPDLQDVIAFEINAFYG